MLSSKEVTLTLKKINGKTIVKFRGGRLTDIIKDKRKYDRKRDKKVIK
jgi:hypothetical protein